MMFTPAYLKQSLEDVLCFIEDEDMERASHVLSEIEDLQAHASANQLAFDASPEDLVELRGLEQAIQQALFVSKDSLKKQMNTQKKATGAVGAYQRLARFN